MRTRSPSVRSVLFALTLLAALQLAAAVGVYLRDLSRGADGYRLPLPNRLAAIVDVVESSPPDTVARTLDAVSDADTLFWIQDGLPADKGVIQMSRVEKWVSRYIDELSQTPSQARPVAAWIDLPDGQNPPRVTLERLRLWSEHPLRIAVGLQDGRWLIAETQDTAAREVFGLPRGLFAGLLSSLVAILSLVALWRGLAPLDRLSRRLEAFARDPRSRPVKQAGLRETRSIIASANHMQARLQTLITEREAMHGSISHDLRTYLTRLRLRLSTLDPNVEVDKAQNDLDEMEAIVERGLLEARLNAYKVELQTLSPGEVLESLAEAHGPSVDIGAADPGTAMLADPYLLRRALNNLIENALRHGSNVVLSVDADGGRCALHVDDDGVGLRDDEVERLRQSFMSDRPEGTGLGLYVVGRIATAHELDLRFSRSFMGGLRVSLSGFKRVAVVS